MRNRKNNRGEIALAVTLMAAWLAVVFTGGITQTVLENNCEKEKAKVAAKYKLADVRR